MSPTRPIHAALAASLLAASAGCPSIHGLEGQLDGGPAAPDAFDPLHDAGPPPPAPPVMLDLLLVIDNSNSMSEEQAAFAATVPRLLDALATGDADRDGARDFRPIESLHVGVISTDLGAGPHAGVPTCGPGLGEDGILRSLERASGVCPEHPRGVFDFAGSGEPTERDALRCATNLGTGGCGFEQHLEAALKAITPSAPTSDTQPGYTPPRFTSADGVLEATSGQADLANAGFVREGSVLAVLVVSDEEDCSVRDYGLYRTSDPRFEAVPLNLRCNTFGDPAMGIVHPVQRYVAGLLGLRRDPGRLVFGGIVGIPPETEAAGEHAADFAAILAHPGMVPTPNAMGTNLQPSCVTPTGIAYPPVRLVGVAAALREAGAQTTLSSICAADFQPAIDRFVARVGAAVGR